MITLFQITGSCSFAVRAALEEGGIPYRAVDVHPRRRGDTPELAVANPLERVATIRDGSTAVYETGAILLYLVERFPGAALGPLPGEPGRGELLRWAVWLGNTLHPIWWPLQIPGHLTADLAGAHGITEKGRDRVAAVGDYLEVELEGRKWCLGDRFSVADLYLYMLTGWQHYNEDGTTLGGSNLRAHYERVGGRPAVARTRALDDLDERLLRLDPERRGGKPV